LAAINRVGPVRTLAEQAERVHVSVQLQVPQ
jgi:hypothetical protein